MGAQFNLLEFKGLCYISIYKYIFRTRMGSRAEFTAARKHEWLGKVWQLNYVFKVVRAYYLGVLPIVL